MKRIQYILLTGLLTAIIGTGCNKKLEEKPQSILTPAFFSTTVRIKSNSCGVICASTSCGTGVFSNFGNMQCATQLRLAQ